MAVGAILMTIQLATARLLQNKKKINRLFYF